MGEQRGARVCEQCGKNNVYIINTRYDSFGKYVRRRLYCEDCEHRWTTYEVTKEDFENVKKANKIMALVKKIMNECRDENTAYNGEQTISRKE